MIWTHHCLNYSPLEGHLGCFQFWATSRKIKCCQHLCKGFCLNICFHFSGINPQESSSWLNGRCVFRTVSTTRLSKSLYCLKVPTNNVWAFQFSSFSASSPAFDLIPLFMFHFSHFNRCLLMSYCSFILHFNNDKRYWISFHIPFCYLYSFFGEMSLHVFCSCSDWNV